jgi:hypothetical protein
MRCAVFVQAIDRLGDDQLLLGGDVRARMRFAVRR